VVGKIPALITETELSCLKRLDYAITVYFKEWPALGRKITAFPLGSDGLAQPKIPHKTNTLLRALPSRKS
jgi:hypothetical protein